MAIGPQNIRQMIIILWLGGHFRNYDLLNLIKIDSLWRITTDGSPWMIRTGELIKIFVFISHMKTTKFEIKLLVTFSTQDLFWFDKLCLIMSWGVSFFKDEVFEYLTKERIYFTHAQHRLWRFLKRYHSYLTSDYTFLLFLVFF